jgi:methylenetetrahydrofolate dehydrogenase (NADP+)/methenyltetrahydrofolate cyclohydrolase
MLILDGKIIAEQKLAVLKNKISSMSSKPKMSIIQVGDVFESNKYIDIKIKQANNIGVETNHIKVSELIEQDELIEIIEKENKRTDGLIIQLPLPNHLDKQLLLNAVDVAKDIDGLSQENYNLLYENKDCIFPATAKAIISLLSFYNIPIKHKNIGIIGESNLVGKPTKELLRRMGGVVESFNLITGISGSENADILIVAAGSPNLVKVENIKEGATIVDVGVSKIGPSNKIYGDVDFESVKTKASAISPTIGGVGPLTVVSLLENLIEIYETSLLKNN